MVIHVFFYCINILINIQVLTFTKKNLVCYLSKILACGLVTECRLGILDGMKSEERVTFIWGQRFCLIVNYKCVCWGGGGEGVDTGNCRFAAAVIILNEIS